jgi:hypothetical protein
MPVPPPSGEAPHWADPSGVRNVPADWRQEIPLPEAVPAPPLRHGRTSTAAPAAAWPEPGAAADAHPPLSRPRRGDDEHMLQPTPRQKHAPHVPLEVPLGAYEVLPDERPPYEPQAAAPASVRRVLVLRRAGYQCGVLPERDELLVQAAAVDGFDSAVQAVHEAPQDVLAPPPADRNTGPDAQGAAAGQDPTIRLDDASGPVLIPATGDGAAAADARTAVPWVRRLREWFDRP